MENNTQSQNTLNTASDSNDTVTFIIPHKGRFEMLKQTLSSIAMLDYAKELIQVIVVSQTPEIASEILLDSAEIELKIITRPSTDTISALRNIGVQHASGAYLAFLDADILLSDNWLSQMLYHIQQPNRIIVSAMQVCEQHAPPLEKIRTHLSNAELDCNVSFLPGRNLFMRRSAFEQIGGFPEHLITCEDYYFTDQASKLGTLYYTSDANYVHLGEDKLHGEMFNKEVWRGQSNLQSIKGRRIPLREIPSFVLPISIIGCLAISLIAILFHAYGVTLSFIILGLLPVLAYSIRLYKLANKSVSFSSVLAFYTCYFPARAIGTVAGLFKSIGANHK